MKTRKQRRLEAKLNNTKFEPQYNGNSPVTHEDYYGIGNERFDDKFHKYNPTSLDVEKVIDSLEEDVEELDASVEKTDENKEEKKSNKFVEGFKKVFKRNK